jgi:sugar phosphate isomerase/epimerase
MKLACITDEISQDFGHALDVMLEYGVTGAELRGLWKTNIADLTDEQVERAKAELDARNMTVPGLATPFYKCDLAPETVNEGEASGPMHLATPRGLEEQIAMLHRCIRLARVFNTNLIRVFAFWRKEALTPALEERIIEAFREPVRIAEEEGVILTLENEHACYIGTGAEAARILSAFNSPNFRAVWDPGNAICAGELPYPDGYEAIKPWITHIHIKDCKKVEVPGEGETYRWGIVGEGDIDYVGQIAALRRDGYEGWLSLETHYHPENGDGELGSRQCFEGLKKLLG